MDLSKKAVLLSGPPGIGKTSSAMIITRSACPWQVHSVGAACSMLDCKHHLLPNVLFPVLLCAGC